VGTYFFFFYLTRYTGTRYVPYILLLHTTYSITTTLPALIIIPCTTQKVLPRAPSFFCLILKAQTSPLSWIRLALLSCSSSLSYQFSQSHFLYEHSHSSARQQSSPHQRTTTTYYSTYYLVLNLPTRPRPRRFPSTSSSRCHVFEAIQYLRKTIFQQ
jgi:hypothetical protein